MRLLNNSYNALPEHDLSPSLYGHMEPKSPLAATLKSLRKGLKPKRSQEEVASEIGATQAMYSKWETGAVLPGLDYAVKLARVFEVGLDELVVGMDKEYDLACQTRTGGSASAKKGDANDRPPGAQTRLLEKRTAQLSEALIEILDIASELVGNRLGDRTQSAGATETQARPSRGHRRSGRTGA